ncbi:FAD dependent oxidoreductase [Wallemia mellicola]|uniref:FAD dependent oxidoreductase n=1 Tax=Wallemia mellicola TaxID=1708541 RepID=A0AB74KBA3_9BASI|nr:FAD dependent oxidoreductase [Wallemia mellicola]TIC60851.1 FAD dependent oxidoreductase [Wallemia mellicola]
MPTADELKTQGNAAFAAKDYNKAIEIFTQAISLDASNHVLYSNRSASYAGLRNYEKALEDANTTIAKNAQWAKGYARKGAALHGLHRYMDSVEAYESGLKVAPTDSSLQKGLADVKNAAQSDDEGPGRIAEMFRDPNLIGKLASNPKIAPMLADPSFVAKLKEIQSGGQPSPDIFQDTRMIQVMGVLMGVDLQAFERPEGSDELPENLKKAEPAPAPAAKPAAAPAPEAKMEEAETSTSDEKKEALKAKQQGNDAYKARKFDEAIQAYEKAWELDSTDISYLTNLSAVYFEKGDLDKCLEVCEKAVEEGRSLRADYKLVAKALGRIGSVHYKKKDLDAAVNYFNKSLTEHRSADILNKLRATEKEKKDAEIAAYINPELSEKSREEGNAAFKRGEFAESVKLYTEAIKRLPDNARAYTNRATAYNKLAALPEALKDANKAIEIDPSFVRAHIRKAMVLFGMRDYTQAAAALDKATHNDKEGTNGREIREWSAKIQSALYSQRSEESDEQTLERAMRDPEIASIMGDPVMQSILQQSQTDPAVLQHHMKSSPAIQEKVMKLVNAGIIKTHKKNVLIVGAGIFGLSTAYALLQDGYTVTIVEQSDQIPAAGSASTDISKIVRADYGNAVYSKMASESIADLEQNWTKEAFFHQSGMLVLGESEYAKESYEHVKAMYPTRVSMLDKHTIRDVLPKNVPLNPLEHTAYVNRASGWIESGRATAVLAERCEQMGAKLIPNFNVKDVLWKGDIVEGVENTNGDVLHADLTIIACGAWSTLLDEQLNKMLLASAQSVAMIKLNDDQYERYKDSPIIINLGTGFYMFPPTESKYFKISKHHAGYISKERNAPISLGNAREQLGKNEPAVSISKIPTDMYEELRGGLREVYPEIANDENLEWKTRVCWYSDAQNGDFIIDYHQKSNKSLLFATGGSGHAYKMYTILGKLVKDRIEGQLSKELSDMFTIDRDIEQAPVVDHSRLDSEVAVDDLQIWMKEKYQEFGYTSYVLVAHSMGGLLAADLYLKDTYEGGHLNIKAVLNLDSPMVGLHPNVFAHTTAKFGDYYDKFNKIKEIAGGATVLAPFVGALWGTTRLNESERIAKEEEEKKTKQQQQASTSYIKPAGAAIATVSALGAGVYFGRDKLLEAYRWTTGQTVDHLLFLSNLWNSRMLKERLESISTNDVLFKNYYTHLPHLNDRTFCLIPSNNKMFIKASNTLASDEVGAHIGMFNASSNSDYHELIKNLVQDIRSC